MKSETRKFDRRIYTIGKFLEVFHNLNKDLPNDIKKDTHIILFTDLGQIILNHDSLLEEDETLGKHTPVAYVMEELNEAFARNPDLELVGSGSHLVLRNVELKPLSNPNAVYHLAELVLFADSIKGFTTGRMS